MMHLSWSFEIEECNDLAKDTYLPAYPVDSRDEIKNKIEEYKADPPSEVKRYKFHYILKDRAGNEGRAIRTIELRGSPNLFPSIFFVLAGGATDGVPLTEHIIANTATLPPFEWVLEVGGHSFDKAPDAITYTDLGGNQREVHDPRIELKYLGLDVNQTIEPSANFSDFLPDFFTSVNYWNGHFISGTPGSYSKPPEKTVLWENSKVVLRYSAKNELGNESVRDIEVRLIDTTPPTITKNSFDGGILEVGDPFEDPGVVISDAAGSSIDTNTTINLGFDSNSTFDELANRGFWEEGTFTITYNAVDEFGNQAVTEELALSVQDGTVPHVFVMTHDALGGITSGNLVFYEDNKPAYSPFSIFETFRQELILDLSDYYNLAKSEFYSEKNPYVREKGDRDFYLNSSELDPDFLLALRNDPQSLVSIGEKTIKFDDPFGRTFSWYSPIDLEFNNSTHLRDPGFLIYESSEDPLLYTPTIRPRFHDDDKQQIEYIALDLTVSQTNDPSLKTVIYNARTYFFLDDVNPYIEVSPATDGNYTFVQVEAGDVYLDQASVYPILENGAIRGSETLIVSAYDLTDGDLTDEITRTIVDLNGSGVSSVQTGYEYVNHVFQIKYDVDDKAVDPITGEATPNSAISQYRYVTVKDTIAPLIYPSADSAGDDDFEVDYQSNSPDVDSEKSMQYYLLTGLTASDYGQQGAGVAQVIDPAFDWFKIDQAPSKSWEESWEDPYYKGFVKWTVVIKKPSSDLDVNRSFEPGRVYPFAKSAHGYDVEIRAIDEFGNISQPRLRTLKVSDTKKPTITLLGSSEIHDFLRYGKNSGLDDNGTGPNNQELLFADRPHNSEDNPRYDSSGFGGGAHRLILDNYDFVDPGAYAEDSNSYFSVNDGYPDFDNDGVGETYAIRRVTEREEMLVCDDNNGNTEDIGVIFAYSVLEKPDISAAWFQELMENDDFGINTSNLTDVSGTIPPFDPDDDVNNTISLALVKVPDVNGSGYDFDTLHKSVKVNLDVVKITIEYRVKDGWDNYSEIKERVVYFYESRIFPNFAFYATPLTDTSGTHFEDLYETESGKPYLNDLRKDLDGDGYSDFWEKAFGSNPEDRGDVPSHDLTKPTTFTLHNTPGANGELYDLNVSKAQ